MKVGLDELIPGRKYRFTWNGYKQLYQSVGTYIKTEFEKGLIWTYFRVEYDDGSSIDNPTTYSDLLTLEPIEE